MGDRLLSADILDSLGLMLVHPRGRPGEPRPPEFDVEPIPPEAESNYFAVHCDDWMGPGHPKGVWTPPTGIEVNAVRAENKSSIP